MSFRVVNRENGAETGKLRGNVVLGRKARDHDYDDRSNADRVNVDEYARVPGEMYNKSVSRNHLLVAENPTWIEETTLSSGAREVDTGEMDLDVWDLNSTAGTGIKRYDPQTGHPVYEVGDAEIEIRPLNHYLGIAGSNDRPIGFENNIESLADNLGSRGFETNTVSDATWNEVDQRLERLEQGTEEESQTLIMYSGHGTPSGKMALDDRRVQPDEFIRRVDELDGEKLIVVDQCHAGHFADYHVPEDMTIYMASGAQDRTQANSMIEDENRTRYAGRVVEALESETGEVSLDDIHRQVASVGKVAANNPQKHGNGAGISRTK